MKSSISKGLISILAAFFACGAALAAQNVPVQFTSYSVLIMPGQAEDPLTGLEYTLGLSSAGDEDRVNSELMLALGEHGFSHESFFVLEDPFHPNAAVFWTVLDIPLPADVNSNGIDDFYEVSAEVNNLETVGLHPNSENEPVEFYATWIRGAGETIGFVLLNFPYLGLQFEHQFQLVHYSGEYLYNKAGTSLQGTLSLTNALDSEDRILGPLSIQVANTNTLSFSASTWNNGAEMNYVITTNVYDGRFETNFFSYWLLEDGYPANSVQDYRDWMMIFGSADENENGILDLVETDGAPAQRPTLSIAQTAAGFEITITGTAGKSYWLQSVDAVTDKSWANREMVTMTGDSQTINLAAAPGSNGRFFRLVEN